MQSELIKLTTLKLSVFILSVFFLNPLYADDSDLRVGITSKLKQFNGTINRKPVSVIRNQDTNNTVDPAFAKTSRPCPPFCIQPMVVAPGVETIGELELIEYIRQMSQGDNSLILIDSRTEDWVSSGTIPGAINIPWTALNPSMGADPISIGEILTDKFGASELEGLWDFSKAKTLIFFCNGAWCGQSPNNIKNLLRFGYPATRIKWYRGGMQSWETLGFEKAYP